MGFACYGVEQEAGLADRIQSYVAEIADWSPDVQLGALVCTPEAFTGLSPEERGRAIELLQGATRDGGVHLVGTIVRGQRGLSVSELRRQYKGWSISIEEDSASSKSFLARKIAS